MLELVRIDSSRQIIVGNALALLLAEARTPALTPAVVTRGQAVVDATKSLAAMAGPTPAATFFATRSVFAGIAHVLEAHEKALNDAVVPLGDAQSKSLAFARTLSARVFNNASDFAHLAAELQWSELSTARTTLASPDVDAAVVGLGLKPAVDHLLAHVDLLGRVLGKDVGAAGSASDKAGAAWHAAFVLFVAQVAVDYDTDPKTQDALFGAYEAQVKAQHDAERERRLRSAAKKAKAQHAPAAAPAAPAVASGANGHPAAPAPAPAAAPKPAGG